MPGEGVVVCAHALCPRNLAGLWLPACSAPGLSQALQMSLLPALPPPPWPEGASLIPIPAGKRLLPAQPSHWPALGSCGGARGASRGSHRFCPEIYPSLHPHLPLPPPPSLASQGSQYLAGEGLGVLTHHTRTHAPRPPLLHCSAQICAFSPCGMCWGRRDG